MEKIKVKIVAFDEESLSLVVAFGDSNSNFDASERNVTLAYQPTMWPDVTDPNELLKRIAFSGIGILETEKLKKDFATNSSNITTYKSMAGQVFEFSVQELLSPIVSE
jgi:hypothetical protein